MRLESFLALFLAIISCVAAWDQSELEIFDLIEEINVDFYEFLGVSRIASTSEIKRAYRKLSLEMHPDKNSDDPNAGIKFRQLSTVYQILKDKERRERYDDALVNGVPDWKTPVFYYRKLRKMSNFEIASLFSAVAIVIHFATLWGFAFERRWTLREKLENHMKKHKASEKKKIAIDLEIEKHLKVIKWPNFWDILPFALVRGTVNLILSIPAVVASVKVVLFNPIEKALRERKAKKDLKKVQQERMQRKEQQKQKRNQRSKPRDTYPDFDGLNPSIYQMTNLVVKAEEIPVGADNVSRDTSPKSWTHVEEVALIKLSNKYPGGFPNRWSKIAEILGRTVYDVTSKAAEIASDLSSRVLINPNMDDFYEDKSEENEGEPQSEEEEDDYYMSKRKAKRAGKLPTAASRKLQQPVGNTGSPADEANAIEDDEVLKSNEEEDEGTHVSRRKKASRKARSAVSEADTQDTLSPEWTQKEQNQLETAINSFPKGTPQRWQLVAECVPSKTLTEVIERVKYLSEHSKKKLAAD